MKANTSLPSNYSQYTILEPSKSPKFILMAIVTGIVLLLIFGWLFVFLADTLRPTSLDGMRLRKGFSTMSTGISFAISPALLRNIVIALVAVLIVHELVHGLFYWLFSSRRPKFGFQGLFPYAAASISVYLPRKQFITIGLAPLVLLTAVSLLLLVSVPIALVPLFFFFVASNAPGAAGDLIIAIQLMSFSSDNLMEDNNAGLIIYGPKRNRKAA